jgi:hypothetical protein
MPAVFSVIGPVLNRVGGVVLIRVIIQNDERAEGHNNLGWLGLRTIVIGTVFDVIGTVLA